MQEQDLDRQRYETIYKNLCFEDGLMDAQGNWIINQAPHCDPLILHAPGTCTFCDKYSERQQARIARRTAFTGEPFDLTKTRCPSEYLRPAALINRWERNRPTIVPPEEQNYEIVEAIEIDEQAEQAGYISFSQIVSHLGGIVSVLRMVANPAGQVKVDLQDGLIQSSLSSAEALVEILRSDIHPPLFIEPNASETVIVAWIPNIHDLATEVDPPGVDGKVVAYIRPKEIEDDSQQNIIVLVNGKELMLDEIRVSYHSIVEFVVSDLPERPDPLPLYSITYKGATKQGSLAPRQAIEAEPGMKFSAFVTNNA